MKYKSFSQWPEGLSIQNNISTNTHQSKEHAEAVCRMLRDNGFGGDGKVFPIKTWVEPFSEAWPMKEEQQRWVLVNAHRLLRKQYRGAPLWTFVKEMTAHGCGYSCEICIVNGWNPDQDGAIPIDFEKNSRAPSIPCGGRTSS